MLKINDQISIPEAELSIRGIRASGPGGQNVNKVSSAVHVRFDIERSSLPQDYKDRLLALRDSRITADGVINIKAQRSRSFETNRLEALERLANLIASAGFTQKPRKPTRPSRAARQRRLDQKTRRAHVKTLRGRVVDDH
jgi:ribosome-associated protein